MEKTAKTSNNRNMHAIILGVLGIILVIAGTINNNDSWCSAARLRFRHYLYCVRFPYCWSLLS